MIEDTHRPVEFTTEELNASDREYYEAEIKRLTSELESMTRYKNEYKEWWADGVAKYNKSFTRRLKIFGSRLIRAIGVLFNIDMERFYYD